MEWKELLKLIYEVKGYSTDMLESMVDFEKTNIVLTKKELTELASKLEVQHDSEF